MHKSPPRLSRAVGVAAAGVACFVVVAPLVVADLATP
jgi:hypothetical protein